MERPDPDCIVRARKVRFNVALRPRETNCCLMSTEARWPIRDGDEWEKGDRRVNIEIGANPEVQGCRGPLPEQQNVN